MYTLNENSQFLQSFIIFLFPYTFLGRILQPFNVTGLNNWITCLSIY